MINLLLNLFGKDRPSKHVHYEMGSANGKPIDWAMEQVEDGREVSRMNGTVTVLMRQDGIEVIDGGQHDIIQEEDVIDWFAKTRPADYCSCDWYIVK